MVAKRQIITNKLASKYEPAIYKVVKRTGAEVTIENTGTGTQYRRNVAHVKKLSTSNIDEDTSSPSSTDATAKAAIQTKKPPPRKRQMSNYYQHFNLSKRLAK